MLTQDISLPDAPAADAALPIDTALVRKYGGNGPRYTSYPTADRFNASFDIAAYRSRLGNRSVGGLTRPLGLYVHVPFCDTLCFYCACNKIATKDKSRATRYVDYLLKEIDMVADAIQGREVCKMHWGGGTPTFLSEEDSARLVEKLRSRFNFQEDGEYAIEIDPRRAGPERIAFLAKLGFNRLSIGVQDFDETVQKAVNRIQTVEQTRAVIEAGRAHGFKSINMDLIYGLPKQTLEGFAATLERVIECSPDRIALYSYAHLPTMFKPQRRIVEAELPTGEIKLQLMTMAIRRMEAAGYVYIGMDHFAKPDDELAVAQRQGRLTRDFQGYSVGADCDIVGFGVSSIGKVGASYVQSEKALDKYYEALDAGDLPVLRGMGLDADDLVRRAVIQEIACQYQVSKEGISHGYLIDFDSYFATELELLKPLIADGLVEVDDEWIHVTHKGRLLVRAVCMVFDKYLRIVEKRAQYSRVM
jgi:oxygen-independent coproporphyrinogen III oxidase